jgi:hypothetical protein
MYRQLCQQAWICDTRPLLPDDDDDLWVLAGCESKEQWLAAMRPVRSMFTIKEKSGKKFLFRRKLGKDWEKVSAIYKVRRENGRLGGRPPKTKDLYETKRNQELTRAKAIEVEVEVEVESKESKSTTGPHKARPNPDAPCGNVENTTKPTKEPSEYVAVSRLIPEAMRIVSNAKAMGNTSTSADVREELKIWAARNGLAYDSDSVSKAITVAEGRSK